MTQTMRTHRQVERDRLRDALAAIIACEDNGDTELLDKDMGEDSAATMFQSAALRRAMQDARQALAGTTPDKLRDAAPELLAALGDMLDHTYLHDQSPISCGQHFTSAIKQARAAIAKATTDDG